MTSNLAQREIADEAVQRRAEMARRGEVESESGPLIPPEFAHIFFRFIHLSMA